MNFKATVNSTFEFDLDSEHWLDWDIVPLQKGKFHIIRNNKSFNAELVAVDWDTKFFTIKINGFLHEVWVKDQFDLLIQQLGLDHLNTSKVNDIIAPMPGLVLDVLVEAGSSIEKGTPLLILEAMKMENVIKATANGIVKNIIAQKGNTVDKGQVLIELE